MVGIPNPHSIIVFFAPVCTVAMLERNSCLNTHLILNHPMILALSRGAYNTLSTEAFQRASETFWRPIGLRIAWLSIKRMVRTGWLF